MRLSPMMIAAALLSLPLSGVAAEDAAPVVSRYYLKDGRQIDGLYDKQRGIIVLTGKIKMELAVKPEDIERSEPLKGVVAAAPEQAKPREGGKVPASSQEFAVSLLADFERSIEADRKVKVAAIATAKKALEDSYKRSNQIWEIKDADKREAEQKRLTEQNEKNRKTVEVRSAEVELLGKRWAFSRAVRQSMQKYSLLYETLLQSPTVVWREDAGASFTTIADSARSRFSLVLEKERKVMEENDQRQQVARRWDAQTVRRDAEQQKIIRNEMVTIYFDYYSNLFINTRMVPVAKDSMELTPEGLAIVNDYVGFHRRIVDYCKTNKKNVDPRLLDVFVGVSKLYFSALKQAPPQDFRSVINDYREFVENVPSEIGAFDPSTECLNEFNRMKL
ncbi:MAG: hypothetical protein J0M02_07265 [Planctomycetes bacterium]|nr:hypothetical protein [Planctomycetota bacterium]